MTKIEQDTKLNQALTQFKKDAPDISIAQQQELSEAWWALHDSVQNIYWKDSWMQNGEMTDQGISELAEHTQAALGQAMLNTYEL